MRSIPRLSWLNARQYPTSVGSHKNSSGHGPEHTDAIATYAKLFPTLTPEQEAALAALKSNNTEA